MSIRVSTDVPQGNAAAVSVSDAGAVPEIRFTADPRGGPESLWFRFGVTGTAVAVRLVLENVQNLLGGGSYPDEDQRAIRPVLRREGGDWERLPAGEMIRTADGRIHVGWDAPAPPFEVAVCYPYSESDVGKFVAESAGVWQTGVIGVSAAGRPLVRLSNGAGTPGDRSRPGLYLMGRQHAGETPGSWVLEGVLRALAAAGQRAPLTWAVPLADADGVERGDYGKDAYPFDINRAWTSPPMRHEVHAYQQDLTRWAERCAPALVIDFHAPGLCEHDGLYAFLPPWEELKQQQAVRPWAQAMGAALGDIATEPFAQVANYPMRGKDSRNFMTWCRHLLSVPALTIETPYALARSRVLTREVYLDAGARIAGAVLERLSRPR